ncbi:DUF3017 domain-containing protein [Streptomyces sp. NPDC057617]|uniref:DUF3017 domain-containing protein n=1 Tax=Streptomyces sp. NPDC057617 TaxID=3346184 RepID=UPI0036866070
MGTGTGTGTDTGTGDAARPKRGARERTAEEPGGRTAEALEPTATAAAATEAAPGEAKDATAERDAGETVVPVAGLAGADAASAPASDPVPDPVPVSVSGSAESGSDAVTDAAVTDEPAHEEAPAAVATEAAHDEASVAVATAAPVTGAQEHEHGKAPVATAVVAPADAAAEVSPRFSAVTRDTARPEGGGRAAPGDASAPVRQWPLLSVLGTIGLGLLIVGLHPFAEAFRIGTILIGLALIGGALLRRVMPSVGMLAVRSRFTDMATYGLLGIAIVMLSLMTQPKPWLEIPFLEDVVHSTVP